MNLRGIANGITTAVNPNIRVKLEVSAATSTAADGIRTPIYGTAQYVNAQMQPLSGGELRQMEGLNLQGDFQAFYLNGRIDGLVRSQQLNGSKITHPNGSVYLVTTVLENYANEWTKVAATLQNDGA